MRSTTFDAWLARRVEIRIRQLPASQHRDTPHRVQTNAAVGGKQVPDL
jgi:hypothetical protein